MQGFCLFSPSRRTTLRDDHTRAPQTRRPNRPAAAPDRSTQANEATLKNLSDDREAMKQSIRGLRAKIEQLAGERERAEKDSLEHTRLWQERAEELKAQGVQVWGGGGFLSCSVFLFNRSMSRTRHGSGVPWLYHRVAHFRNRKDTLWMLHEDFCFLLVPAPPKRALRWVVQYRPFFRLRNSRRR